MSTALIKEEKTLVKKHANNVSNSNNTSSSINTSKLSNSTTLVKSKNLPQKQPTQSIASSVSSFSLKKRSLFQLKTPEGYTFKIIFELLKNCVNNSFLSLRPKVFKIHGLDSRESILIIVVLTKDNFLSYYCKEPKYLDINQTHCHSMLKSIKKKDGVSLIIDPLTPCNLSIKPERTDSTSNTTTKTVKIMNIGPVKLKIPSNYGEPVVSTSKDFQRMIKDISSISGKITRVISNGVWIRFLCDNGGVYGADVTLGETEEIEEEGPEIEFDDSDDDEDNDNNMVVIPDHDTDDDGEVERVENKDEKEKDDEDSDNEEDDTSSIFYDQTFDTATIVKLLKMAGLSKQVLIYPRKKHPLKFEFNIFSKGTVEILIKSREILENEETEEVE